MIVALVAVSVLGSVAFLQMGRTFSYAFFDSEEWDRYAILYLTASCALFAASILLLFVAIKHTFPILG